MENAFKRKTLAKKTNGDFNGKNAGRKTDKLSVVRRLDERYIHIVQMQKSLTDLCTDVYKDAVKLGDTNETDYADGLIMGIATFRAFLASAISRRDGVPCISKDGAIIRISDDKKNVIDAESIYGCAMDEYERILATIRR